MELTIESHPSLDDLELYVTGRPDENTTERVEEHLLVCESCRCALDEIEQEIRVLRIVLRGIDVGLTVH